MLSFFSKLKTPCKLEIQIDKPKDESRKRTMIVKDPYDQFTLPEKKGQPQKFYLFDSDDSITGNVVITPEEPFIHLGIKIELIGEITLYLETKQKSTFTSLTKELCMGDKIEKETTINFQFKHVEMDYESYRGINVDLRYYLRVTIVRSIFSVVKEQEFWVQKKTSPLKSIDNGINMEVGLEKIVLLSIKYENVNHDLKTGCIQGLLKFYLVKVDIEKAEVSLIKHETSGQGDYSFTEKDTLIKYEVIDGTPAKNVEVPVRMYLSSIDPWKLISSSNNIHNKFSIKYFIHLALCDKTGRRFFKQKELHLFRSGIQGSNKELERLD